VEGDGERCYMDVTWDTEGRTSPGVLASKKVRSIYWRRQKRRRRRRRRSRPTSGNKRKRVGKGKKGKSY